MDRIKVITLLSLLFISNLLITGCLEEEKPKEKAIELEFIGSSHKVYAGDSTTYVILLSNNRDLNDTIILNIESKPTGWDVMLNLPRVNLTKDKSIGFFLVVNTPSDAKKEDHKVKVQATSDVDGSKNSITITTKVIEKDGVRVQQGDKVLVDYIGYLTNFSVFDTSIEDISDNKYIRKTPDSARRIDPIYVYVGSEDPDPSDPYGIMPEGFWEALVEMKEGQSRTVVIPPEKAYAEYANTTLNITEEVTMLESLSLEEYQSKYIELPIEGVNMKHYFWGWNVTVDYVNESENVVKILNEPDLNQMIVSYGWESEVIYKNRSDRGGDGRILIEHHVEVGTKGIYQNHSAEVIGIEGDQFDLEFNKSLSPLAEEVLTFDITLIEIAE
ncbi:MAG: FKBP-type peptidyl-prolyl cis-trans isomerase [Thermoplasmata archaeon]|nr:MAG: FKBP-type peptidyl-prolyl cis-trans isomerase [Thermoplasmata archaeon]